MERRDASPHASGAWTFLLHNLGCLGDLIYRDIEFFHYLKALPEAPKAFFLSEICSFYPESIIVGRRLSVKTQVFSRVFDDFFVAAG